MADTRLTSPVTGINTGMGLVFKCTKVMANVILDCRPISGRLFSIRLGAAPSNITIIQVCTPSSGHATVNYFHQQFELIIGQTLKKKMARNAIVGGDAQVDWVDSYGTYCNDKAY